MRIAAQEPDYRPEYARDLKEYLTRGVNPHDPFPTGLVCSSYWQVWADGQEVMVFDTPVTHAGPHSFALLPANARQIKAISHVPVRKVEILPERLGIAGELAENTIVFSMGNAHNVMLETNGTSGHPLSLFVATEETPPDPEDENVLWFEPGLHRIRNLEIKSGQTLYLAPGAVLTPKQPDDQDEILDPDDWAGKVCYQDFLYAKDQKNIRICGQGMIDTTALDWHARRTICFTSCENIEVTGITMVGACSWTMPFFGCKNVHVDSVRMLGYRENSDGIDLVDTHNALVENCFIRTGDDAICLKSMAWTPRVETHDILVRNCTVWNDKVRAFGVAGETRHDVYRAVFEHCDVLHSMADWTTEVCALGVYICDAAKVSDITFRDIDIRQESNHAVCCCIVKDKWSTDDSAGQIQNIRFEDIHFPEDFTIYLSGYDQNHALKNIHFQDCICGSSNAKISLKQYAETVRYTEGVFYDG